jgi:hypothetical protein
MKKRFYYYWKLKNWNLVLRKMVQEPRRQIKSLDILETNYLVVREGRLELP